MTDSTLPPSGWQPWEGSEREAEELRRARAKASLVECMGDIKREDANAYKFVDSDGNGALAAVLVDAIYETIDSADWLDYVCECLRSVERLAQMRPDGFVYVLQTGEFYKIGRAKRLDARIKTLKIQLPFAVSLITAFPCEDHARAERFLHEHYAQHRVNGEWFRLPDGAISWLSGTRYMMNTEPDDPWYRADDVWHQVDHSDRVPAALMAEPHWARAFAEVEAAGSFFG